MKKNYFFTLFATSFIFLCGETSIAQSLEDFESEAAGSATFIDDSQTFTVSSTTGENYNVFSNGYSDNGGTDTCSGCGWNGTGTDNKFIDNSGSANNNGDNNGSSFTITTGGAEIGITSLYLFCSTRTVAAHTGSVTITGKKGGITQYSFTKSSGFANVTSFTPNNGFTFIDFATEGGADYTQTKIDELEFTSTGNLDYMALDGFSWAPGNTLAIDAVTLSPEISIYPNPSSDFIQISRLNTPKHYTIYNVLGKEISQGKISNNNTIDIRNFANGLYFIHFENKAIKKFIKK